MYVYVYVYPYVHCIYWGGYRGGIGYRGGWVYRGGGGVLVGDAGVPQLAHAVIG